MSRVTCAQVRVAGERAMVSSQRPNAKFATAAARKAIVHPYVFRSFPPKESVTTPRPTRTTPLLMRTPAQKRRWRYSHGEIMRRMPDRAGDAHSRGSSGAVLSLGAFIGMPPMTCGTGHSGYLPLNAHWAQAGDPPWGHPVWRYG